MIYDLAEIERNRTQNEWFDNGKLLSNFRTVLDIANILEVESRHKETNRIRPGTKHV